MVSKLPYKNEIATIVITLFFFFFIINIISGHSLKMQELMKEQESLKETRKIIKSWESLDKDFLKARNSFFFQDLLSFKRFIEKEAEKRNIAINYLRPSQKEGVSYQEVKILLKLFSLYGNFVTFLKSLENKDIKVEKLEISGNTEEKQVIVTLRGIIFKEKK